MLVAAVGLHGWSVREARLDVAALFVLLSTGGLALMLLLGNEARLWRLWWGRLRIWGWWRRPRLRELAGGAALVLAIGLIMQLAVKVLGVNEPTDATTSERATTILGNHGMAAQISMILLICLLGPLLEEALWRGYLLPLLRTLIGGRSGVVIAVGVTSVFFGLAHAQYGAAGQLTTAINGVVYAAIAIRTGSLVAPWVAHASWNTTVTVLLLSGALTLS